MSTTALIVLIAVNWARQSRPASNSASDIPDRYALSGIAERHFGKIVQWFELDAVMQTWLREELDRRIDVCLAEALTTSQLREQLFAARGDHKRIGELIQQLQNHNPYATLSVKAIAEALRPRLPREKWEPGFRRLEAASKEYIDDLEKEYREKQRKSRADAVAQQRLTEQQPPLNPQTEKAQLRGKSEPRLATKAMEPSAEKRAVEWETLVRNASAKHAFTPAQRSAALALLEECKLRANTYHLAHAGEYKQIESLSDAARRESETERLEAPITAIGRELRERLDHIRAIRN